MIEPPMMSDANAYQVFQDYPMAATTGGRIEEQTGAKRVNLFTQLGGRAELEPSREDLTSKSKNEFTINVNVMQQFVKG